MSYDLSKISFFQFDNLVQNRIPFLLLHDGVDFFPVYPLSIERGHLEKWSFEVDFTGAPTNLMGRLAERGLPASLPIVLLSKRDQDYQAWLKDLEKQGFSNIHYVENGWNPKP
jgi:hypothetical protein